MSSPDCGQPSAKHSLGNLLRAMQELFEAPEEENCVADFDEPQAAQDTQRIPWRPGPFDSIIERPSMLADDVGACPKIQPRHSSQIITTQGPTVITRKHKSDSRFPDPFWPPALTVIVTSGILQLDSRSLWSFPRIRSIGLLKRAAGGQSAIFGGRVATKGRRIPL